MDKTELFRMILLILLVVCAVCVNLAGSLLRSVVIFMSYSSIMCILWILMESPDLAITEAAVGAGVSGILFLVTLKKIGEESERMRSADGKSGEETDSRKGAGT